jgi:hypothetical protein
MKTRIVVTKKDIKKAREWRAMRNRAVYRGGSWVPGITENCPIAKALQRRFVDKSIKVGYYEIIGGPLDGVSIISSKAMRFMDQFDSHKSVKPFSFTVER